MSGGSVERLVQAAIYTVLKNDSTYMALIPGGLFDLDAPEGTAFPFTVIGEMTETAASTHDKEGWEVTVTLHTWTMSTAKGRKTAQLIRERQRVLLHRALLSVSGYTLTKLVAEFGQVLQDQDDNGEWAEHGIDRYRCNSIEA